MEGGGAIDNKVRCLSFFLGSAGGWRVAVFTAFVSGLDNCYCRHQTADILHGSVSLCQVVNDVPDRQQTISDSQGLYTVVV